MPSLQYVCAQYVQVFNELEHFNYIRQNAADNVGSNKAVMTPHWLSYCTHKGMLMREWWTVLNEPIIVPTVCKTKGVCERVNI